MSIQVQQAFSYEERMGAGLDLKTGEIIDIKPTKTDENALDALTDDLEKRNEEAAGGQPDLPPKTDVQKEKEFITRYLHDFAPTNMKLSLDKLKFFCDGADPDFNAEKITGVQDLSDEMVLKVAGLMREN